MGALQRAFYLDLRRAERALEALGGMGTPRPLETVPIQSSALEEENRALARRLKTANSVEVLIHRTRVAGMR